MGSGKFEITLCGDASVLLPAERAVLRVEVSNTEHNKQTASNAVVSTAKSVEALLRKLGPKDSSAEAKLNASVDHWSRTSMSETNQIPYDHKNEKHRRREYTSTVSFEVRFQQFQAIAGLIQDLAALPHVETRPLQWILMAKTKDENRSALRVGAAKNAHEKALEYAMALGYQKVEPFQLSEGHMGAYSSNSKAARLSRPAADVVSKNLAVGDVEMEDAGEDVFRYQPEDVKMSASVDASFYAL